MLTRSENPQHVNIRGSLKDFCFNQQVTQLEAGFDFKNITSMYRNDMDWNRFSEQIIKTFPDGVNIICQACCDGSDAYSLALELMHKLNKKEQADFFPIKARDLSGEMIHIAEKGLINLSQEEVNNIVSRLGSRKEFSKYFRKVNRRAVRRNLSEDTTYSKKDEQSYKVNKVLKGAIQFRKEDLFKMPQTLDGRPTIVMARNVMPYWSLKKQQSFATELADRMTSDSWFITGDLEETSFRRFNFHTLYRMGHSMVYRCEA